MDLYDEIYYSLIGELEEPLDWVPNAFGPGSACEEAYARLIQARNRVQEKLGTEDDRDLSQMLTQMHTIQHLLCRTILELRK